MSVQEEKGILMIEDGSHVRLHRWLLPLRLSSPFFKFNFYHTPTLCCFVRGKKASFKGKLLWARPLSLSLQLSTHTHMRSWEIGSVRGSERGSSLFFRAARDPLISLTFTSSTHPATSPRYKNQQWMGSTRSTERGIDWLQQMQYPFQLPAECDDLSPVSRVSEAQKEKEKVKGTKGDVNLDDITHAPTPFICFWFPYEHDHIFSLSLSVRIIARWNLSHTQQQKLLPLILLLTVLSHFSVIYRLRCVVAAATTKILQRDITSCSKEEIFNILPSTAHWSRVWSRVSITFPADFH